MLSRSTSHTRTSSCESVDLARSLVHMFVFEVSFYISVCSLVSKCSDCSGSECLSRTENNFGVLMSLGLVLTGKIQVNIGLLVAFESEECFKRNIKTVFFKRRPAFGTQFIGHIATRSSGIGSDLVGVKIHIMAGAAIIMRWQGINFGNPGHCGNKGGPYRSSRPNKITILI